MPLGLKVKIHFFGLQILDLDRIRIRIILFSVQSYVKEAEPSPPPLPRAISVAAWVMDWARLLIQICSREPALVYHPS